MITELLPSSVVGAYRQQGDLITFCLFFQNKESRLKMNTQWHRLGLRLKDDKQSLLTTI
jgi:hypothetical protein